MKSWHLKGLGGRRGGQHALTWYDEGKAFGKTAIRVISMKAAVDNILACLSAAVGAPGAPRCTLKKPVPAEPRPISSSVASRTFSTFRCRRIAMPASGWLPSSTTCSG